MLISVTRRWQTRGRHSLANTQNGALARIALILDRDVIPTVRAVRPAIVKPVSFGTLTSLCCHQRRALNKMSPAHECQKPLEITTRLLPVM